MAAAVGEERQPADQIERRVGERDDRAARPAHVGHQVVRGAPEQTLGPLVGHADLAIADEGAQAADEAMRLGQRIDRIDHAPIEQREVASVDRHRNVGQALEDPVEGLARRVHQRRPLTRDALAVDDLIALAPAGDEVGISSGGSCRSPSIRITASPAPDACRWSKRSGSRTHVCGCTTVTRRSRAGELLENARACDRGCQSPTKMISQSTPASRRPPSGVRA